MNKYCVHLNLPFKKLFNVEDWKKLLPKKGHFPIPKNLIDKELIDWFELKGFILNNADVFISPPGFRLPIHVDGEQFSNSVAINWQFCEESGSYMEWWQPKNPKKHSIVAPGTEKEAYAISTTPYALNWKDDECNLLHRSEIKFPSLVNIGVPHSMTNATSSTRWAVSLTWFNYTNINIEWDYAITKLKSFIS